MSRGVLVDTLGPPRPGPRSPPPTAPSAKRCTTPGRTGHPAGRHVSRLAPVPTARRCTSRSSRASSPAPSSPSAGGQAGAGDAIAKAGATITHHHAVGRDHAAAAGLRSANWASRRSAVRRRSTRRDHDPASSSRDPAAARPATSLRQDVRMSHPPSAALHALRIGIDTGDCWCREVASTPDPCGLRGFLRRLPVPRLPDGAGDRPAAPSVRSSSPRSSSSWSGSAEPPPHAARATRAQRLASVA